MNTEQLDLFDIQSNPDPWVGQSQGVASLVQTPSAAHPADSPTVQQGETDREAGSSRPSPMDQELPFNAASIRLGRLVVPSIEQQTGWHRPGPQTIMPYEQYALVTQYNFELCSGPEGASFRAYVSRRCGHCPASDRVIAMVMDYDKPVEMLRETVADKNGMTPQQVLASDQRIMRNTRAMLQDCWELFWSGLEG